MKPSDKLVMKAVALCYKPYLKPEEGMIYCNLERTQFLKRCDEFRIYKNNSGYFKRADLDMMMSGEPTPEEQGDQQMKIRFK
ncbi:MAG: hypothetical protein JST47_13210 [Bacteroidetes bacterium]|nr:hypothetical protein [Bacteroidota bacterium]